MNITLPFPRFENRSLATIRNDINDELDFHIQCRIDELVEEGMSLDQATTQANEDFGCTETIRKQCEQINIAGHRLLLLFGLGLFAILISVIGWLAWQLMLVRGQNIEMSQQLMAAAAVVPAVANSDEFHDLTGTVSGPDGVIEGAKVLLVFKSWPNGNYQQEVFSTTTDEDGNFNFEELYETGIQTAFLVSIVKDGYTLESKYWTHNKRGKVKPVKMKLKKSVEKTLVLLDDSGEPLANTHVCIQSRNLKPNGKGDLIYMQSSDEVMQMTDDEGKVAMNHFVAKDKAIVIAYVNDRPIEMKFEVDASPEQTVGGGEQNGDSSKMKDLTGTVVGTDGDPVANAIVLLVHKDWPNRYRQRFYKTETDENGKFKFAQRYNPEERNGFLVTVFADGRQMESQYVFKQNGGKQRPFKFKLDEAILKTFIFEDENGLLKREKVCPWTRKTETEDFIMFPQAIEDLDARTNSEGKVELNHFVVGDIVTFQLADGREIKVEVDGEAEQVVSLKKN